MWGLLNIETLHLPTAKMETLTSFHKEILIIKVYFLGRLRLLCFLASISHEYRFFRWVFGTQTSQNQNLIFTVCSSALQNWVKAFFFFIWKIDWGAEDGYLVEEVAQVSRRPWIQSSYLLLHVWGSSSPHNFLGIPPVWEIPLSLSNKTHGRERDSNTGVCTTKE